MQKMQLYTVVTLSFCSTVLDFMLTENYDMIFPRDRIIHIFISVAAAYLVSVILSNIDFENMFIKYTAVIIFIARMLYMYINFSEYFRTFHGSGTFGIIAVSLAVAMIFYKFIYDNKHLLYSFFIVFNITLITMIVLLCIDKVNVINIYSNSQNFDFDCRKLAVMFDIITISAVLTDKRQKYIANNAYLLTASAYFVFVTLVQGLCIGGNMLYSISPLQSLMQIASTATIRRFDYIFTIYHAFNYLAAVVLYTWAIKHLLQKERVTADE